MRVVEVLRTRSLADLVPAEPPTVTVFGIDSLDAEPNGVRAALLCWGRHRPSGRWAAGVCWPFGKTRGSAIYALLTTWVPAENVRPHHNQRYGRAVARIELSGPPETWPTLPGIYPRIGQEWLSMHLHSSRPDPQGEYRHLRDAMRAFRRR